MAKKEGTSQTYGQLILFPSKEKGFNSSTGNSSNPTINEDIIVKLIPRK